MPDARTRDTIVIGTSAGGIEALTALLPQFTRELRASICIVQHLSSTSTGRLLPILEAASPLPIAWARDRAPLREGHVYLAPVDRHLLITDHRLSVTGGPRENRMRPSIDPLFRSAASNRGSRVIGVLLSGLMDDGVAGLRAIQRCGGATVIQDPTDAEFPDLPRNAEAAVEPTAVVPVSRMGRTILDLTHERARPIDIPPGVALEASLAGARPTDDRDTETLGRLAPISCPECGGPLWTMDADPRTFRCHVGHAFAARALLDAQRDGVERSLWTAVRALQQRASTLESLAEKAMERGHTIVAQDCAHRAREAREHSDRARKFLLDLQDAIRMDPPAG